MNYIENISSLNTRKLNQVTRGIINDFVILDINNYTNNYMILSSVVASNNNSVKNYIDLIKYSYPKTFYSWSQRREGKYKCNIQQIKKEYSGVFVCLYFSDCVAIYCLEQEDILNLPSLYKWQHADNSNEAQFAINQNNITLFDDYLIGLLKYEDIIY